MSSSAAIDRVIAAAREIDAPDETLGETEAWSAVRDERLRELRLALAALVDSQLDSAADDQTSVAASSPDVASLDDLWAWMNTWGDLYDAHDGRHRSRDWRDGYQQAIRDLFNRLAEMGVENCSDESWRRFTGRG